MQCTYKGKAWQVKNIRDEYISGRTFFSSYTKALGISCREAHTGKGTAECWSQKKGSCIFIEMVWDNCVCLKVK